jgi:hypothetical protein
LNNREINQVVGQDHHSLITVIPLVEHEHLLKQLEKLGGQKQEIDLGPFLETGKLLYHGPWAAERFVAIKGVYLKDQSW